MTDYIDCNSLADTCEENLTEVESIMGALERNEVTTIQTAGNELEESMHVIENIQDMVG